MKAWMDGCSYANKNMCRMYGMVYLDASLTSSILGAELSQLFCIKISQWWQRKNIINAVQLELNVVFFLLKFSCPMTYPLPSTISGRLFFLVAMWPWVNWQGKERIICKFKILNLQWLERIFSFNSVQKKVGAICLYLNAKRNMTALNAWERLLKRIQLFISLSSLKLHVS